MPTCALFSTYYKSLLVNNAMSKHSSGANCEPDNDDILTTLKNFICQDSINSQDIGETTRPSNIILPTSEKITLKPLESAALAYVAGYVIKTMKTVDRSCEACKFNVLKRQDDKSDINPLTKAREYGGKILERLTYVNGEFITNLSSCYNIIKHVVGQYTEIRGIKTTIISILKQKIKFNFVECEHSTKLLENILNSFCKLVIFNNVKGLSKLMNGKDLRPLPKNATIIAREARLIWEKKSKRKS